MAKPLHPDAAHSFALVDDQRWTYASTIGHYTACSLKLGPVVIDERVGPGSTQVAWADLHQYADLAAHNALEYLESRPRLRHNPYSEHHAKQHRFKDKC